MLRPRRCAARDRSEREAAAAEVGGRVDPAAGHVSDDILEAVFRDARRQRLRPGSVLFSEGDVSNRVILLVTGRVKISSFADDGRETVIGFRGPGSILGDLSGIDGAPHIATVTVVDDTEVLVVPVGRLLEAIDVVPGFALLLLRSLAGRLRTANRMLAEFGTLDVTRRVARRLSVLAETDGQPAAGGIRIGMGLSQRELAGWIGASREAVNKALAQLEDEGLLAREGRRLVVIDLDGLRQRSG
jgi:CRP/FNR family cyclic AMP-dependent transcriptional regulator